MSADGMQRKQNTIRLHLGMEVKEFFRKITEASPDRPKAMEYFDNFLRRIYCDDAAPASTRPLIGTMCVQVPDELIYAAGAVPYRLCNGSSTYDLCGAEFMPAKSCPVVRATTGMLHAAQINLKEQLAAVIIPTTCDQKKKAGELIASMGYKVHFLEMPSTCATELSRNYWQDSVQEFTLELQKITGQKITPARLKKAIQKIGAAGRAFRQLYNLRQGPLPILSGVDAFLVSNGYFLDDIDNWTAAVEALNNELIERQKKGTTVGNKNAPRFLFTGSPPIFPNFKIPMLVEEAGGVIVTDEACSSTRLLYDAVAYDEEALYDMLPAIADRYLKPCTCPCLTPNENRKRKLLEMIDSFSVDGVIYQAYSGCHPYEMEQMAINDMLAEKKVPMLYVETDFSKEDMGQLTTRVEAFIESIQSRKRRKKI